MSIDGITTRELLTLTGIHKDTLVRYRMEGLIRPIGRRQAQRGYPHLLWDRSAIEIIRKRHEAGLRKKCAFSLP